MSNCVGAGKRGAEFFLVAAIASITVAGAAAPAAAQRVLGLDVSYWQGQITQSGWNTAYNTGNRQFVFIRSSRGGTTGVDQGQGTPGGGSQSTLSRRYDDPRFVQNITRATQAGLLAGAYHFSRPDITTNTGTDEANHFIEMAGPWMRPGYLLPVHDFEAGDQIRTDNQLAQFTLDFSDRIYEVMGIRPAIYVNGNYAHYVLGEASSSLRAQVYQAYPTLWIARWPNQSNPNAIDVQNEQPDDSLSWLYGLWDDYGNSQPWAFWQYASTASVPGLSDSTVDVDVSHGDIEYLKDYLVPALWMNDSSGDWSTLLNWNSGQTPQQPPIAPGQATPYATGPLPTPRLPGVDDAVNNIDGQNDTVVLDRPNANITVTLSSGTHNIRKLFVHETLDITGGSLTINYDPNYTTAPGYPNALRSGPISAQFSGPVSLSGSGALSVHTLQVDATHTFTLGGGTLTFDTINLMPHSSNPAKIAVTGDVDINPLNDATATIARGSGSGATGSVDLGGGNRTFNVGNGSAAVDLSIDVPITNGGLIKNGAGTMRLGAANTFSGPVTVNSGMLQYGHSSGLPSSAAVTVNNGGTLDMNNISDTIASLAGTGSVLQGAANLTLAGASGSNTFSGPLNGSGTLTKSGGSTQILTGFNTHGAVNVSAGSLILSGNNNIGVVNVSGGALILNGSNTTGAVTVNGGTLGGNGSVSGLTTINSGGHVAPGESVGIFTANGGLILQAGSILDFELATTSGADTSDIVLALGAGGLTINGGTVNLTDAGGMTDGTYNLFGYSTLSGSLSNLSLGTTPEGFNYELVDTGSLIQVMVTSGGLPGDFNNDGSVDATDYALWRKDPGSFGGQQGYDDWRDHFGQTAGGGASQSLGTVPEPASVGLLAIALAMLHLVVGRCPRRTGSGPLAV